jgi:ABC-type dipeptide/oligopeptide/nickel transport system permease subunit
MINIGTDFMYFYWHLAVFPTAALAVTVWPRRSSATAFATRSTPP